MPYTQIRGNTQIQEKTITLDRLVNPFIDATTGNWDITNSGLDATITGIPDPVNDYDVANKHYVDSLFAGGISWKEPVRVLANTNVDISNPPSEIDGVTLATGDRIALFNQTTPTEDGVYVYNGAGNALTRATDWETGSAAASWTFWVMEGDTYADTQWTVTNDAGHDVVGTDDLTVVQIAGQGLYTFQNGLTKTGSVIEWGGDLLQDTTVSGQSSYGIYFNQLTFFSVSNSSGNIYLGDTGGGLSFSSSSISVTSTYLRLSYGVGSTYNRITIDNSGITVQEQYADVGMVYAADYFANGHAQDRWLPDWAAVKNYQGIIKVRVMATGDVDITSAPAIIDGVTLANGDLVALFNQATSTEDGIYVYNGSGNAMDRAAYYPTGFAIGQYLIAVKEGTVNGQSVFMVSEGSVLGTDDILVVAVGGSASSYDYVNGLHLDGGYVKWGGDLIENTNIIMGNYNINFNKTSSLTSTSGVKFNLSAVGAGGSSVYKIYTDSFGGRTSVGTKWYASIIDATNQELKFGIGTSGGAGDFDFTPTFGFKITTTDWIIYDEDNGKGMAYNADYHVEGISQYGDRWIPDWGTVKNEIYNPSDRILNEIHVLTTNTTSITVNSATTGDGKSIANVDIYVRGLKLAEGTNYDFVISDSDAGEITFNRTIEADSTHPAIVLISYDYK